MYLTFLAVLLTSDVRHLSLSICAAYLCRLCDTLGAPNHRIVLSTSGLISTERGILSPPQPQPLARQ